MQFYTTYGNDNLDVIGAYHNNGSIILRDSTSGEVATLTFGNPAFSDSTGGILTATAIGADSSAAGGTVNHAITYDSSGNEILKLTTGTNDGTGTYDVTLTSLTVSEGEPVSIPTSPGVRIYLNLAS